MSLPAPILSLSATDHDLGDNGAIHYSLVSPPNVGYVDANGTLYLNNTSAIRRGTEVHLVVAAEDFGAPRQRALVPVRLQNLQHSATRPQFTRPAFEVRLRPDVVAGDRLADLEAPYSAGANLFYALTGQAAGNPYIGVDSATGALILRRQIVDPALVPRELELSLRRDNRLGEVTTAKVQLNLGDWAAKAGGRSYGGGPFARKQYEVNLSENTGPGNKPIFSLPDYTVSSGWALAIAAGNTNSTFSLLPQSGDIQLAKQLDYETQAEYRLTLLATSSRPGRPSIGQSFETATLLVRVLDENDNAPYFPVTRQIHSIRENRPAGSLVFTANARDLDSSDSMTYALSPSGGQGALFFSVGPTDGRVVSTRAFDYETEREFSFRLTATDQAGTSATADITVKIESEDEYRPVFESSSYKFSVDHSLLRGHSLGRVRASDEDAGPGGRIVYSPVAVNRYFRVEPATGEIFVAQNLDTGLVDLAGNGNGIGSTPPPFQDVTYTLQASTGREPSLKAQTLVIFRVKTDALPPAPLPSTGGSGAGLAAWVQALIIAFIFIIIIVGAGIFFFKRFSVNEFIQKRLVDPNSSTNMGFSNTMHDTSTLDSTVPMSQYPPPQYSDIVSQYGHSHGKSGNIDK